MKASITVPAWATHLVSDHTNMDRSPHALNPKAVKKISLALPDDVYFEYAFLDEAGNMRADPENPERAATPWYDEVSAIYGPAYQADPFAVPNPASLSPAAQGRTQRLRVASKHLEQLRRVSLYTPKGCGGAALPVVYLQDGVAFYRYAKLHEVFENLLAAKLVRPAHLAFVEPLKREEEYPYNPAYQAFFLQEALPEVEAACHASGERILMGASLGGLVSMLLAISQPQMFAAVLSFSGAFLGAPEDKDYYTGGSSWVVDMLREAPTFPWKVYAEVGTLEWLHGVNRELAHVLKEKQYDHRYLERHAGHNWTSWKNGFRHALAFALGPQAP